VAGLTPNAAAGFLEAAFKLLGQGQGDSAFWLSLAVARSQHTRTVLVRVPNAYSFKGLYRYVFDTRFRATAIETAKEKLTDLQVRAVDGEREAGLEMRRLKTALDYEETIAPAYSEKERSGVNRTLEIASSMSRATLEGRGERRVPVSQERFFQAANTRAQPPPGPREGRPLVFLCDEYQQVCSGGDALSFDTSRALGVVAIVAAQSLESYIGAIGDESTAVALLANFTTVVAFRSTERTMNYLAGKLGEVDVWEQSYNMSKSDQPTLVFPKAASVSERPHGLDATRTAPHGPNLPRPRRTRPSSC